jgi:hypothetical protein
MKEELIGKLMEKSLKYLETAEAFTVKEVPLFVKELLEYKFVEHVFSGVTPFMVCFLLMTTSIVLFVKAYKHDGESFLTFLSGIFVALALMSSVVTTIKLGHHSMMAYKAKYAPRVYLMDYVRK